MEAWDAIRARRNVREYTSEPVSDDDLNRIAEAGWRAPSAKNRQAWDFVIVTDPAQLKELSTVWQGAGHIAGAAAAIAVVLPAPPSERRKVTDQSVRRRWQSCSRQPTLALGLDTRRWESRTKPAPFWVCPRVTRWLVKH
jgi:nitroreductase